MKTITPARIAILRHGYYPNDPRVFKEVRALIEAGYEVDVLCLRGAGQAAREVLDGVQVIRAPLTHRRGSLFRYLTEYGWSFMWMAVVVTYRHFWRRYGVIQVNTLPDALVFATLVPKLLGAYILLDMHEPTPELYATKYTVTPRSFAWRLHGWIEQMAIRYADTVLTVNDTIRQRFIERGAPAQRLLVVRNVPDESLSHAAAPKPAFDGPFTLVTHGTIQPRYGHEIILRALPVLRERIPQIKVIIIGDGETAGEIKQLALQLHCDDLVSFTGQIPFRNIPQWLMQADVGLVPLLPSPFSELCQPNKLFEYISLGIPVIASRLAAMEETFDDSCVRYFPPGDHEGLAQAVLELYESPERRRELVRNASRIYERVRWRETRKTYLTGVEQVLQMGEKACEAL
jgi:glycosyltransferase involved in cell wall biosynthesis